MYCRNNRQLCYFFTADSKDVSTRNMFPVNNCAYRSRTAQRKNRTPLIQLGVYVCYAHIQMYAITDLRVSCSNKYVERK